MENGNSKTLVVSVIVKILSPEEQKAAFENVKLVAISLHPEERLIADSGPVLSDGPSVDFQLHGVHRESRPLSPRLWNLPEIFKRMPVWNHPTSAQPRGIHSFENEEVDRWVRMVRYNFSNGVQITAQEILRHPAHRLIPPHLLPGHQGDETQHLAWSIVPSSKLRFLGQASLDVLKVIQSLLQSILQIPSAATQNDSVQFYYALPLQGGIVNSPCNYYPIRSVEWNPDKLYQWEVLFSRKTEIECNVQLVSKNASQSSFYETHSLIWESGTFCVYDWKGLLEVRGRTIHTQGEESVRKLIRDLRSGAVPVVVRGGHVAVGDQESHHEIQFKEENAGTFDLILKIHPKGSEAFDRVGWSMRAQILIQTLTSGLPFVLNQRAIELASKHRAKREWDLKLLKHIGILEYLAFEVLSVLFEGTTSDGKIGEVKKVFGHIKDRIRSILVSGPGVFFVKEATLDELCSPQVLQLFENFVDSLVSMREQPESFFNEDGEVIIEGVLKRELRLIFEFLKKLALSTGGEVFRRSRAGLLSQIGGGAMEGPWVFASLRNSGAADLAESLEAVQGLLNEGFKVKIANREITELSDGEFSIDFHVESVRDKDLNWFELNPKFFLKGQELDSDQILTTGRGGIVEYEGRLYLVPKRHLPSMKRLENFWRQILPEQKVNGRRKAWDKLYRLPKHQTLELLALRASGVAIRGDQDWQRICDFYDALGTEKVTQPLPQNLKGELKAYQRSGFVWLSQIYELRLGALLADDMGLGKTVQTLAFLSSLHDRKELGQSLIVVPSSLVYNWMSEAEKFTPDLPIQSFVSRDIESVSKSLARGETKLLVVTYGLLVEHSEYFQQYQWNVVCFDEAQNLKNITAKRTTAARALKCRFKVCLTGTPMENHYGEFYSILDLVVPGCLGAHERFRKEFVNAQFVSKEALSHLRLKVKPILLRRTKKEIIDQLPEKQESVVRIGFEERQKEIYRDVALSYNVQLREAVRERGAAENTIQLQMLTALLRLRQVCSDPAGIPQIVYDKIPPKIEALANTAEEIVSSGASALVFTQFLKTLEHTQKVLTERNIPVFVLHGGLTTPQRQKVLEEFNALDGGAILLMTLKTGGVGLNLTKASYVFHLEPWWNPSVENQATDRVHRIGQTRSVQVFRYIMHESLEEKIELLKEQKGQRFTALLSDVESAAEVSLGSNKLTQEDFEFLLS